MLVYSNCVIVICLCIFILHVTMPRVRKFNSRKYYGNQHIAISNVPDNLQSEITTSRPTSNQPAHKSASSTTLENTNFDHKISYDNDDIDTNANLKLISNLIKTFVECSKCDKTYCKCLDKKLTKGLAYNIVL